jgi:hypothetical protein
MRFVRIMSTDLQLSLVKRSDLDITSLAHWHLVAVLMVQLTFHAPHDSVAVTRIALLKL